MDYAADPLIKETNRILSTQPDQVFPTLETLETPPMANGANFEVQTKCMTTNSALSQALAECGSLDCVAPGIEFCAELGSFEGCADDLFAIGDGPDSPHTRAMQHLPETHIVFTTATAVLPAPKDDRVFVQDLPAPARLYVQQQSMALLRNRFHLRLNDRRTSLSRFSPSKKRKATSVHQFGMALDQLVESSPKGTAAGRVPSLLHKMVTFLSQPENITAQGLLRVGGSMKRMTELRTAIENGSMSFAEARTHDVASLLKQWVRELPDCVLTNKLAPLFIKAFHTMRRSDQEEKQSEAILMLCLALPPAHFATLKCLLDFAEEVAAHSETNAMTLKNVALTFATNLFPVSSDQDHERHVDVLTHQFEVFKILCKLRPQMGQLPSELRTEAQAFIDNGMMAPSTSKRDLASDCEDNDDESGAGNTDGRRHKRRRTSSVGQMLVGKVVKVTRQASSRLRGSSSKSTPVADLASARPATSTTDVVGAAVKGLGQQQRRMPADLRMHAMKKATASSLGSSTAAGRAGPMKIDRTSAALAMAPSFSSPMRAVSSRVPMPTATVVATTTTDENALLAKTKKSSAVKRRRSGSIMKLLSNERRRSTQLPAASATTAVLSDVSNSPSKRPDAAAQCATFGGGLEIDGSPNSPYTISRVALLSGAEPEPLDTSHNSEMAALHTSYV